MKQLWAKEKVPFTFFVELVPYLQPMHNAKAEFRRLYLWKLLVGHPYNHQGFAKLTFCRNGWAGNISHNEDIIDFVLDFVCGVGTTDLYWVLDFI